VETLRDSLANRTLAEFLPICMYCKNIRDDDDGGEWSTIETYITKHTGSWFSHGFCPTCAEKFLKEYGGA
jgi:sigma-B regulation protein RsbU (phosphoserine phosphatase)